MSKTPDLDRAREAARLKLQRLAPILHEAWRKYERTFQEPPHGTLKQIGAMLELAGEAIAESDANLILVQRAEEAELAVSATFSAFQQTEQMRRAADLRRQAAEGGAEMKANVSRQDEEIATLQKELEEARKGKAQSQREVLELNDECNSLTERLRQIRQDVESLKHREIHSGGYYAGVDCALAIIDRIMSAPVAGAAEATRPAACSECARLRGTLERCRRELLIPAAEYVPAIPAVIEIIEDVLATPAASAEPLLKPGELHPYTSTACGHGLHERCRQSCKFCAAPCMCHCHAASAGKTENK